MLRRGSEALRFRLGDTADASLGGTIVIVGRDLLQWWPRRLPRFNLSRSYARSSNSASLSGNTSCSPAIQT
jgi:hypothetical protein